MDLSTISIWYWIILLLAGIVCAIIGYLWGKSSGNSTELNARLESLQEENTGLKAALESCNEKLVEAAKAAVLPFDPEAAKTALGRPVRENDLKIIEGIGPKIENLFHHYDIRTWKALADAPVAKCQEVLDSGGDRFKVHDPSSWPMQARMASEGRWKALARWQDEHDHGKL